MPLVASSPASNPPAATIVVPSYQASRYIRGVLRSLVAQQTGVRYEILVVDSSADGTDGIVEREFPQVRLLHFSQRRDAGAARNIGVESAAADIILFADADTIVCPTWLDQMFHAIHERRGDLVGGGIHNGTPWSVSGSAGFYLEFFRFLAYDGNPRPARYLVTASSGFHRDTLAGFQFPSASVGEDMLLSSFLISQGKKLLFLPRASLTHLNRTGFRTVFQYQEKLGRGAFLYRSSDSPRLIRLFQAAPALIFLTPFGIMAWIAWTILRMGRWSDLLRFIVILPVCFAANMAWGWGFYQELRRSADSRGMPSAAPGGQ